MTTTTENSKVFDVNEALKVEGFNPNEYARPYDENPDECYLPYEIQKWWFEQVYPKGRIVVSKPEQDPEHTPGAYVATAMIWKDKADEKEDICISNRAVPSEMNTVDPYQDCQRKAVSLALKTLGFWLTPSKVVIKPMVNPDEKGLVEGATEEATPETPVETTTEAPKKRGRKPKEEVVPEQENTEETVATTIPEPTTTEEAPTEVPVEAPVETTPETPVEAPSTAEPVVTVEEVEEEVPTETLMDLEAARNTIINYRTFSGRTMGELADSDNQKDHELLVWFATSSRAATKYPDEVAAAKAILASQK